MEHGQQGGPSRPEGTRGARSRVLVQSTGDGHRAVHDGFGDDIPKSIHTAHDASLKSANDPLSSRTVRTPRVDVCWGMRSSDIAPSGVISHSSPM